MYNISSNRIVKEVIKIVTVENNDLERAIKRFKRQLDKSGKMTEYKKHMYYMSKSEKRKIKHEEHLRSQRKHEQRNNSWNESNN